MNGEFDQVIEVVFTAKAGETFIGVKDYRCHLHINHTSVNSSPRTGIPPSPILHIFAKPDEFFRVLATGQLDGSGKIVDGIVGPKDLTIGPKQKQ